MRIIFIHHSSFYVELEHTLLLFDYFPGEKITSMHFSGQLPEFPADKNIYVFSSHSHQDHFDLSVLKLSEQYPQIKYILSKDIRLGDRYLEKNNIEVSVKQKITFVSADHEYQIDDLKILTIPSTDAGVAFLVEAEGKRIYHAGDLHLWKWEGAGELVNGREEREFKHAVKKLPAVMVDVAFVPLDPRLEQHALEGITYFMEQVDARKVFPMHMWQDYRLIDVYRSSCSNVIFADRIMKITEENQVFELA